MRIAIIGTGGIGAPLGASLAIAGHDVTFVARGAHLAAMQANGLRITGDRGETLVRPIQATDDPRIVGPVELVLFCVKLWDVETAGKQVRALVGPDTAIIPLQNGVDASERLIPILGASHVLGGVAVVTGSIIAPGVVRQSGTHHRMTFGELDGHVTRRVERIRETCQASGIDTTLSDDIQRVRWEKFIMLVAGSGICAVTRRPIGELREDPDIGPLFDTVMQEVVEVGRACGVRFPPDVLDPWRAFLRGVPSDWLPSMAIDIRSNRKLELPWLGGKVVELGIVHGVPTPVNHVIYAALKPYANGAPGPQA
jgi:2-dehydropantoate 2-reductase